MVGVVGFVVGEVSFGVGAKAVKMGGFVDGEELVVFGVGVVVDIIVVGRGVVDVVKTSLISPIVINTADEVGDMLTCVVVDIGVCCCSGCCCCVVVCCCCCGWMVVCCCCCCC